MLPSQGLFKELECPYNNEAGTGCHRPFCHYKHVRRDEQKATYTPTKAAASNGYGVQTATASSYPRYIPFPIGEDDESSNSNNADRDEEKGSSSSTIPSWNNTAEYVPKSVPAKALVEKDVESQEEMDPDLMIDNDLARIVGDSDPEFGLMEVLYNKTEEAIPEDELAMLLADSDEEPEVEKANQTPELPKPKQIASPLKEPPSNGHRKSSTSDRESDRERRVEKSSSSSDRKKSSSSSGGHKSSSSSSSSKHRRSSDSSKHKSSSSSHHHTSSSSSSRRSSDDKRPSSSSKSSSTSSSRHHKPSSESRSKSSSSSSSHKRRHKSSDRDKDVESKKIRHCSDGASSPSLLPRLFLSSDEDEGIEDVEAECKRIFDQFEPDVPSASSEPMEVSSPSRPGSTSGDMQLEAQLAERFQDKPSNYSDSSGAKKRVAHEGGSMSRPVDRAFQAKPKHMQTALQSVFLRTEAVRKQRALEEEKAQRDLEERQVQLSKILSSSGSATPSSCNATPSSCSSSNFRRSLVTPVANIIALQNAKKKIEELRMQQQAKTIARSAPRCTGDVANVTKRVAHKATGAIAEEAAAPPVLEPHSSKINFNLRMQYYNMMVKHCRAIYDTPEDAWERAQTEELAAFKKCSSAVIYKSSATLTINKLRKESISAGHAVEATGNKVVSHDVILAGKMGQKTSWSINRQLRDNNGTAAASAADSTIMSVGPMAGQTFDTISSAKAYNMVAECILDEEQLKENGFPRQGPKPGQAIVEGFYRREQPKPRNEDERYCQRCGKLFNIASYELPARDECSYHPKGTGYRRGFADNQHRCCQQPAGTPGCSYGDYHVSHYIDYANLTGFVKTLDRDESYVCTRKDIYALDCEMVYTTKELELARVTVVDIQGKIVYDACVKPDNHIVDYNTQFSGLTEEIMRSEKRSLRDIQAVLLNMFHSKTILIGHSLDSDLKALKLIHGTVVDTSVLFPHKMGLPKKKALKTLCIDHLKRIIQENEHGHNSAEDAEVCIQLIKAYLKNRV